MSKTRLDKMLLELGLVESREKARGLILAGEVVVNDNRCDKPGTSVTPQDEIRIKARSPFVSRGAHKLESVAACFDFPVQGLTFLDAGASTGGFTDYLLQKGASKVLAVDVGTAQLHQKLRSDGRVFSLEKTHILKLDPEQLPCKVDGVVADLSFISMHKVLPRFSLYSKLGHFLVVLLKPQFEVGKDRVGKGGVVKDRDLIVQTLESRIRQCRELGYLVHGVEASKVIGPKGNREFFLFASKNMDWEERDQVSESEIELQEYLKLQVEAAFL